MIEFSQGLFSVEDLLEADSVWVSNVTGISLLGQIGFKLFQTELPDYLLAFYKKFSLKMVTGHAYVCMKVLYLVPIYPLVFKPKPYSVAFQPKILCS